MCDREDEAAHGYSVRSRRGDLVLGGFVGIDDYPVPEGTLTVADGGRAVLGDERFHVLEAVADSEDGLAERLLAAHLTRLDRALLEER